MSKEEKIRKAEYQSIRKIIKEERTLNPKTVNQLHALDFLYSDEVTVSFSITSKGDGKTTSFIKALLKLALATKLKTAFVASHNFARKLILADIVRVYNDFRDEFPENGKLDFIESTEYTTIFIGKQRVGCVIDLTNANDLKMASNLLSWCSVMWVDEFLLQNGNYYENEVINFQTIAEALDRGHEKKAFLPMKFLFSANPVDFGSEFLDYFDVFEKLETQKINTRQNYQYYDTQLYLELTRNDHVNQNKTATPIFAKSVVSATSGEFLVNSYLLANAEERSFMHLQTVIKVDDSYVTIFSYKDKTILGLSRFQDTADYVTKIFDLTDDNKLLAEAFDNDRYRRLFEHEKYLFQNTYSLRKFSDSKRLQSINYLAFSKSEKKGTEITHANKTEVRESGISALARQFEFYQA